MSYTVATIESNGFTIELLGESTEEGNFRYVTLHNKANGKRFVSKRFGHEDGKRLFWEVSQLVVDFIYGWSDWVEILENA